MKYFATFAALLSTTNAAAADYADNGDLWLDADYGMMDDGVTPKNECRSPNQSPINIVTADWPTVDAADDEFSKEYTNFKYDTASGSFRWPLDILMGDGMGADIGVGGGITYNLQGLSDNKFTFHSKLANTQFGGTDDWYAA